MATYQTLRWTCDAPDCSSTNYGLSPKGWHRGGVTLVQHGMLLRGTWEACCAEHISGAVLAAEEMEKDDGF